jgi:hypothetical protein
VETAARTPESSTFDPRPKTLVIYPNDEVPVGGSKTLRSSGKDAATVVAAGVRPRGPEGARTLAKEVASGSSTSTR